MNKYLLKNQSGVALLMVMSIVAILTYVLADFTYETKLNKLKVYNQQDKIKAKLLAEAGINFTLAKLKLYKETRNLLEEKKNLAKKFPKSMLEGIVTQPFIYPPPVPSSASKITQDAVNDFIENTTLDGNLTVFISSVKGFLNPNNMRIKKQSKAEKAKAKKEEEEREANGETNADKEEVIKPHAYIEKQLVSTLAQAMEDKKETDDIFDNLYGNLQPEILIKELKYFVMDKDTYEGPERGDFDSMYEGEGIEPKHSPLTSISEIYMLQGWNDAIVELMKDRMTVHEVAVIPINDINENQLKALFPNINPEQSKEFFEYRDGTPNNGDIEGLEPHPFKSEKDFKDVIVNRLDLMDAGDFDKLSKDFAAAGLRFGVAGKLYKVTSKGEHGRASYTIQAYIDLPIRPQPEPKKKKKTDKSKTEEEKKAESEVAKQTDEEKEEEEEEKKKKKEPKVFLMEPRIVEIKII